MRKYVYAILISVTLGMTGCGGAKRPSGVTVNIPKDAAIYPNAEVLSQVAMGDLTTVVIRSSNERSEFIDFYDRSYSDWQSLTAWETRKIDLPAGSGWKAWKKGDTYAIIAMADPSLETTGISHVFGSKVYYEIMTKDDTNKSGLDQSATPPASP